MSKAARDIVTTDKHGRTTVDGVELLRSKRQFLQRIATASDGTRATQVVISIDPAK